MRYADSNHHFVYLLVIGDNPYADIAGANGFGWNSLLVRTGVYKGEGNHHIHPATAVVDDVEEAVRWIISKEIMKKHEEDPSELRMHRF